MKILRNGLGSNYDPTGYVVQRNARNRWEIHRPCTFASSCKMGTSKKVQPGRETLDAAIATGRKILADNFDIDQRDGVEIWLDQALLYRIHPLDCQDLNLEE